MSAFKRIIDREFPGALTESRFLEVAFSALQQHGFSSENTLPCVGVCRDELCRSLPLRIAQTWAQPFKFSSLAGMLFVGRTGFGAARAHSPIDGERERYAFIVMTHIGVGAGGEVGRCDRINRPGHSTACGALAAFQQELASGTVRPGTDPGDLEQSLLKQRLIRELTWGKTPDLIEVTHVAQRAILADLEALIADALTAKTDDWAVFNGIQIHGPNNAPYVWPAASYVVVGGERQELTLN